MTLDIIIPVKDDPRIIQLLFSINRVLTNDSVHNEYIKKIYVVVNGAKRDFLNKLYGLKGGYKNLEIIQTPIARIGKARNLAIIKSKSDYVIHLDSDCELADNYFYCLRKVLSGNPHSIINGKVIFIPRKKSLFSKFNCYFRKKIYVHYGLGYMPNLIVKRRLYARLGLLQEQTISSDDSEWMDRNRRVITSHEISRNNDLVVFHHDDKSFFKTIRTWLHYGQGSAYSLVKNKPVKLSYFIIDIIKFGKYFPNSRFLLFSFFLFVYCIGFFRYFMSNWPRSSICQKIQM